MTVVARQLTATLESFITERKTAGKMPALPFAAFRAGEFGTDARRASFRRRHPWTALPRRIVTHVLRMAACEVGDPIAAVVLVKSDDLAIRPCRRLRGSGFTQF